MPPPSLQHPRQHRVYAVERSFAVDLDSTLPLLRAPVLHQRVVHDSGAVDEDLHGAKLLFDARHERADLLTVRNICRTDHALPAVIAVETSLDLQKRFFPARRERHVRAPAFSARATAVPIPLEAPVTTAILLRSEPYFTRILSPHNSAHENRSCFPNAAVSGSSSCTPSPPPPEARGTRRTRASL